MAARPLVGVQGADGESAGQTKLPAVFTAPIRPDVVQEVRMILHAVPFGSGNKSILTGKAIRLFVAGMLVLWILF
jgi:hypothetical protein